MNPIQWTNLGLGMLNMVFYLGDPANNQFNGFVACFCLAVAALNLYVSDT